MSLFKGPTVFGSGKHGINSGKKTKQQKQKQNKTKKQTSTKNNNSNNINNGPIFLKWSVYKNPFGDAFEERSEQVYLLVISGMKLARRDPKNIVFGCRDIQGSLACLDRELFTILAEILFRTFLCRIFSLAMT